MSKSGGVGEPSFNPPQDTPQAGPTGPVGDKSGGGGSIGAAMSTPVHNLGELKQVLISNLGQEKGTQFYNMFLKTMAMMMLSQVQQSAEQAKKASQQMRMRT